MLAVTWTPSSTATPPSRAHRESASRTAVRRNRRRAPLLRRHRLRLARWTRPARRLPGGDPAARPDRHCRRPSRTPRSLTIHYASAPEPGPVEIRHDRRARRTLAEHALGAHGTGGRVTALALAAFSVPWKAPDADELPMPELAPPDAERRSTPKLFKGAPEFTRQLVMQPRVGAIPFAGSGAPMRIGGWIGLPEPRPVDALALALFCDAWFPPSFIALRLARGQPHDRPDDPLPPAHLRVRLRPGGAVPERVRNAPAARRACSRRTA